MKSNYKEIELEYVYVTIPKDYICVYHRILALLADYGAEMLRDCKASCTDRNSGVIECFNMFNSAVAARKLGEDKLAATIIKYVKAKLNQLYKGVDNSTSFVFPVDETGHIKALVSCGENPKFYVDVDKGELLEHKLNEGFDQHFQLGEEDLESYEEDINVKPDDESNLYCDLTPRYDVEDGHATACAEISIKYNGVEVPIRKCIVEYYFDGEAVTDFRTITDVQVNTTHTFMIVVHYKGFVDVVTKELKYEISD